jgi:four helix bundle protein
MPERIERFEDLVAWQKARELHACLQQAFQSPSFARAFSLRDQLERAAVSTMGNIAEGYERSGLKEFAHGLSIAKGSNGEVRSHLYAAKDAGYLSPDAFNRMHALAEETSKVIAGLRAAVLRGTFRQ